MQVERLLRLLHSPHKITPEDVPSLQDLLQRYPYFQAAYALLAKAAYDQDPSSASQAIQVAAVYATNRNYLKALLEDTPPFAAPASTATPAPEEKARPQARGHDFINSYLNTIRQKAKRPITKAKSLAQRSVIQAFVQKDVHFSPQPLPETPNEGAQLDLTHKSTAFHDDLATETLAQVLVQQGKLQQALAIYDKLILKFPEKRTYFVSLIAALKSQS